jgi:rRNA-processing protein FCF1
MISEEQLFLRFKGKAVLLDSNLLLVFLAGFLGARGFKSFKRVSGYTFGDHELLARLLGSFSILLTTPHILTEVSNLANSLTGSLKNDWDKNFAALVRSERTRIGVREKWTSAADLSDSPEFFPFGISDTAIARLASEALVVTGDYRLSGFLRKRGVSALNFNDLRRLRLYKND